MRGIRPPPNPYPSYASLPSFARRPLAARAP